MKPAFTDPVVLICSGILVVGFFSLIWAVAKFRRLVGAPAVARSPYDDLLTPGPEVRTPAPAAVRTNAFASPPIAAVPVAPAATVSKEVSERLDGMTHRLAEMQALLTKQASAGPSDQAAHGGAVGQGFSPETIDKLLKIIGNVVQQVDILQKNLNPAREGSVAPLESPADSVTKL